MLVSDFIEDLRDASLEGQLNYMIKDLRQAAHLQCQPYLILRVQHDFQTFVTGGDIRSKLHTSCRTKEVINKKN